MKSRLFLFVLVVIVLSLFLSSCGPSWDKYDHLVTTSQMSLVRDWNEPALIKAESCTLKEGELVEVKEDITGLYCGSSCTELTMKVRSLDRDDCSGWVRPGSMGDFRYADP